jgi:sulfur carrier protein ThiS
VTVRPRKSKAAPARRRRTTTPVHAAPVPVAIQRDPFAPHRATTATAPEGATIAAIVAQADLPASMLRWLVVEIDGVAIDRADWETRNVAAGEFVRLWNRPGRQIGRIILTIAVIALAAWVGAGALAGTFGKAFAAGTFAANAAAGTVAVLGSLAINALIPPVQPKLGQQSAPVYQIEGARNRYNPWGVAAQTFGTMRVFPDLIAKPYFEYVGADSFVRLAVIWGFGRHDLTDLKVGDTPIASFEGVEIEHRLNPAEDPPHALWRGDPEQTTVDQLIAAPGGPGPWTARNSATETTELAVILRGRRGLISYSSKNEPSSVTITFEIEYRPAGSAEAWRSTGATIPVAVDAALKAGAGSLQSFYDDVPSGFPAWNAALVGEPTFSLTTTISYQSPEPVTHVVRWAVPKGQYEVRVRRITPDWTLDRIYDEVHWEILESISDRPLCAEPSAATSVFRIRATDKLNGVIDQINAVLSPWAPRLTGAAATRDWEGDFSSVTAADFTSWGPSSNPGELYLRSLIGPQTVPTPAAQIDFPGIARITRYAAQNGWTFNYTLQEGGRKADVARLILQAARARPLRVEGKWSAAIDAPRSTGPVQLLTPRNVNGLRASRTFPAPVHAIRIACMDAAAGYAQTEVIAYLPGWTEATATLFEKIEAPGKTSPGEAWRWGRQYALDALYQNTRYACDVSTEQIGSSLGDLVEIRHDAVETTLGAGYVTETVVVSGFLSGLRLDVPVVAAAGPMALVWRGVDGASGSFAVPAPLPVSSWTGESGVVFLQTSIPAATGPQVGDLVAVVQTVEVRSLAIIRDMDPNEDLTATIELVDYAPERFIAGTPPVVDPGAPPVPAPLPGVVIEASYWTPEGIIVAWRPPDDPLAQILQYNIRLAEAPSPGAATAWSERPPAGPGARTARLPAGLEGRTYWVEIVAIATDGRASSPVIATVLATETVAGVQGFTATVVARQQGGAQAPLLRLSWTPAEDPRLDQIQIQAAINGGSPVWADLVAADPRAGAAEVAPPFAAGTAVLVRARLRTERGAFSAWVQAGPVTIPTTIVASAGQVGSIPASTIQTALDDIAAAHRLTGSLLNSILLAEDRAVAESVVEMGVARTVGPNLVRNGGFADLSGWAGSGGVATISGDRRFLAFTGAGLRTMQSDPIPVMGGAWYSAAGLLFAAAGNRCRLYVQFYSNAAATVQTGGAPVIGEVSGVDWTRVIREDRAPLTRVQAPADAVSARLFVDNFRNTTASAIGPYPPGETYPASPNIGATEIVFARGDRAPRFGQEQAEGSFAARVLSGQLAAGADLNAVATRVTTVEGQINTPTTGLNAKVANLESIAVSPTGAVATQGTEIAAARDGAASLAARFTRDVVAAVDGESVSAATAVQRLTASRDQPNILVNGSFAARRSLAATSSQIAVSGATPAAHVSGWFQSAGIGWIGETDLAGYRVALYNGGGTSYVTSPRSPAAAFVAHSASLEIAAGGHASQTTRFYLNWINSSGAIISSTGWSTSSTTLAGAGTYQRIVLENVVSPSGTAFVEMVIEIALPTGESVFRFVRLRRAKVNVGATATRWGDEATIVDVMRAALDGDALSASAETVLNVLGATSSLRQGAMTKLRDETAFVELLAAAGGGLPALFRLVARSTPGGTTFSEIIQAATRLIFRNTAGTATIEAMRIEDGIVKVLNALWIGTGTVPPLRLEPSVPALIATLGSYKVMFGALGPGGAQMVLWFGPSTISDFSVTRTNGAFALGTDGVVYYGTSPLATGGSGAKGQKTANNNGTSGASTLIAQVTINDAPTGTVDISKSKYECVSGTGTASFRPRVTRQFGSGTEADFAIGFSDELISGGTPAIGVNIADFFQNTFNPTTAGTVTYRLYMDRTAGTGSISTSDCVFSVEQWPN